MGVAYQIASDLEVLLISFLSVGGVLKTGYIHI